MVYGFTTGKIKKDVLPIDGGTMEGAVIAQENTDYATAQVRNAIISTAEPTTDDGANGDIWFQVEE